MDDVIKKKEDRENLLQQMEEFTYEYPPVSPLTIADVLVPVMLEALDEETQYIAMEIHARDPIPDEVEDSRNELVPSDWLDFTKFTKPLPIVAQGDLSKPVGGNFVLDSLPDKPALKAPSGQCKAELEHAPEDTASEDEMDSLKVQPGTERQTVSSKAEDGSGVTSVLPEEVDCPSKVDRSKPRHATPMVHCVNAIAMEVTDRAVLEDHVLVDVEYVGEKEDLKGTQFQPIGRISNLAECQNCSDLEKRTKGKLPYINMFIEGVQVPFLIDTGASVSCLDRSFQSHPAFIQCTNPYSTLLGADDSPIRIWGHVLFRLMIVDEVVVHQFLVADIAKCVLGYDFITLHRITILSNPTRLLTQAQAKSTTESLSLCKPTLSSIEYEALPTVHLGVVSTQTQSFMRAMRDKYPLVFSTTQAFQDQHGIQFEIDFMEREYRSPHIFPIPFVHRDAVKVKVEEMLDKGIIRPSNSSYRCAAVIVRKKDESIRMCCDFRAMNKATRPDYYSLPRIDQLRSRIRGRYFSVVDLKDGFFQIPIAQDSIKYTAVCCGVGMYEYLRMAFGLRNAPPTFQRFMDTVIRGLKSTEAYIDDVVIYSDTVDEHLALLEAFFERAAKYGLNFNFKKSGFLQSRVLYLGFEFANGHYQPKPEVKLQMMEYPTPVDKKGILKFMGLVNYYKDHMPDLANMAAPLYDLLPKYKRFKWTSLEKDAFDEVRRYLQARIHLAPIMPHQPFELFTDASSVAIGACLSQIQDGETRECSFYSKRLAPTQQRYSTTMRETYAMVQSILHFRVFLWGCPFVVYTDHKPLVEWFNLVPTSETYARWMVKLQGMTFEVKYIEGERNALADLMSRPHGMYRSTFEAFHKDLLQRAEAVEEQYVSNAKLNSLSLSLNTVKLTSLFDTIRAEQTSEVLTDYKIDPEKVKEVEFAYFYQDKEELKLIVPKHMTERLVKELHNFGHFGQRKINQILSRFYYWPQMQAQVKHIVRYCTACQQNKRVVVTKREIVKFPVTPRMKVVHIDIVGPLTKSSRGKLYILTIMDRFSRWPVAVPMSNIKTETVCRGFYDCWISIFGCPDYIISDQGSQFESDLFDELLKTLSIKRNRTTTYHPQANGMIERWHSTMKQVIRCLVNGHPKKWEEVLPTAMFAICNSLNEYGVSPAMVMFGEQLAIPGVMAIPEMPLDTEITYQFVDDLQNQWEWVRKYVLKHDRTLGKPEDEAKREEKNRVIGFPHEYVWVIVPKRIGSLYPKVIGPYKVVAYHHPLVTIKSNGVNQLVNVSRVKPAFLMKEPYLDTPVPDPTWLPPEVEIPEDDGQPQEILKNSVGTPIMSNQVDVSSGFWDKTFMQPTVALDVLQPQAEARRVEDEREVISSSGDRGESDSVINSDMQPKVVLDDILKPQVLIDRLASEPGD